MKMKTTLNSLFEEELGYLFQDRRVSDIVT